MAPEALTVSEEVRRIVDAASEIWIRRLIDHSRANSLLFFRDLKVGTLDLTSYPFSVTRLLNGEGLFVNQLISGFHLHETIEEDRRAEDEARIAARKALVALRRKAVSNLEEKGIETLFLAVGMATWPANDGGRPYESPVVLVPARIEARGSGEEELRLVVTGEPQINPVLLYVLEETFRVQIDGPAIIKASTSEDEYGVWRVNPQQAIGEVLRHMESVGDFTVKERVILGNFSFAKMAMVEDIRRNRTALETNPIVAAIAGHSNSRERLSKSVLDIAPTELDGRPAKDDFLVLDADSTQHRAIVLSCAGQNGVVQGPPGTGKSQTIANLIAQTVAEGKRVLFVAEKRAALEAVIKRLSHPDVGLGHITLDLHGAVISRKEVMSRVAKALEEIRMSGTVAGVEEVHREFESRRKALNDHARQINMPRKPSDFSVIRILGRLLRLPRGAQSKLRLRGGTLERLDPERTETTRRWIAEGAGHSSLLLGTDPSPWTDAEIRDGKRAQWALDEAIRIADVLWPEFERLLRAVIAELGITPSATIRDTGEILTLLSHIRAILASYNDEVFSIAKAMAQKLAPAGKGKGRSLWAFLTDSEYREARRHMRSIRSLPASASILLEDALQAAKASHLWAERALVAGRPHDAPSAPTLETKLSELRGALDPLDALLKGGPIVELPIVPASQRIRALADDQRTPYKLPRIHELKDLFRETGLNPLLEDYRSNVVPDDLWVQRFDYVWLYSGLDAVFAEEPALASFSGRTHEQIVAEFRRLDRERVRLAAARVRRLHAESAIKAMNDHFDQTNLVKAEAAKKSRHIPLRDLLSRAPDVLTHIAPCWIASPLSVSQLLDGGKKHFDLVVFDEASQILQEEAVPSLYRAAQVVAAGDRHQLPPTTFFSTSGDGDDQPDIEDELLKAAATTATEAIGGFESLLATLEAFLPNLPLEWHYRSADERLIAFSNQHIYGGRLITFPAANGLEAIKHIHVPHDPGLGAQDESSSPEVQEVIRQILNHAETRPDESLGVIAMGIKHANRVQAALDRELELRPDLADFFTLEREDRFFVKNLETVQGDERDVIILTIGYGKAADGTLPHRFGPLTQDVGYRRLNVAVTRARQRMTVVSSFLAHEIDLDRAGGRGVKLLKAYLEYAASGGQRLPTPENAGEVELNSFEADIQDALTARGIHTRSQFGASRYRIDLVAMHPRKPGRPVLAIECDGAAYHSGATARDRDRLRQSHLQKLGWRFHRIWSTDWFFSREVEIERAVAAYEDAIRKADEDDGRGSRVQQAPLKPMGARPRPTSTARPRLAPSLPIRDSIDKYPIGELRTYAEWIVSDGLLRTDEELIQEIFDALPFRRLGSKIRRRLQRVVSLVGKKTEGH